MFSPKTLQYVLIRSKGQSLLDLQELMHANMNKFFKAVFPWNSWAKCENGGIIYFTEFFFVL